MRALLLAAATLVALGSAAPCAQAWRSQRLFTGSDFDQSVALAANGRGDAAAAFEDSRGVRLALARSGRQFGRSKRVPGSQSGRDPKVAIDESGNVLVVWSYNDGTAPPRPFDRDEGCCLGARMTVRNARNGHFRAVQNLTSEGHDLYVGAAAIAAGRVAIAWSEGGTRIRVRVAPRGRRLGRPGSVRGYGYVLGVSPSRSGATVTWYHPDTRSSIREFRVRRDGRLVARRWLLQGLPEYVDIAMATSSRGDQVASWGDGRGGVIGAVRRHGGSFHVSRLGDEEASSTGVAISRRRAAIVAWTTSTGRLVTASARGGRRLPRGRRFGTPRGRASDVSVAVNDVGRAVLLWNQQPPHGRSHGYVAYRSSTGHELGRHRFASGVAYQTGSAVTIDARSRARVLWDDFSSVFAVRGRYP